MSRDTSRQWPTEVGAVRRDHLERYLLASKYANGRILDAACGAGYGSFVLSQGGNRVVGVDASKEALEFAQEHYPGPGYVHGRIEDRPWAGRFDAVVSLETIEHLKEPDYALEAFRDACGGTFIVSVPNEEGFPFVAEKFANDEYPHFRHYWPYELEKLLKKHGFEITEWFHQKDKAGDIHQGTGGMFLIAVCK